MIDTLAQAPVAGTIWTIPAVSPFLRVLARAVMDGTLAGQGGKSPSALDLAETTILLPTNRAARALEAAFLDCVPTRALILPRIRAISQGEEDLALMEVAGSSDRVTLVDLELPDVMSELERQLLLTELVMKWSVAMRATGEVTKGARLDPGPAAGAGTPAQAQKLARELAKLMDLVETEGVDLTTLKTLVPEEYSEHWGKTLAFLEIVMSYWPAVLADRGLTSFAARRNAQILGEARRLATMPQRFPVIIAGVTGSIPATRHLMAAVARLPHGAIVLPAFDMSLDAQTMGDIASNHPEHPQHGLVKLLNELGVAPSSIGVLAGTRTTEQAVLQGFLSAAMRPPKGTAAWAGYIASVAKSDVVQALAPLELVEAPTAADEAEVIALILREAVETPGRTAALVSPDRLLARRVATRLEAWGIRVDDSAGRPFRKTPPGAFLDLVIAAWDENFSPTSVVALLKHPLARLGLDAFGVRKAARALEIGALRGPVFASGLDGLSARLIEADKAAANGRAPSHAAAKLWTEDWANAHDVLARLKSAYAPLLALGGQSATLAALAKAHVAVAEAMARLPTEGAASPLWNGDAGEAGWLIFQGLTDHLIATIVLSGSDYPDFYRGMVSNENVRARVPLHPRISIWGPFEARLQRPDVVVLGSLNDGTWPEIADPGPWLNRPMRQTLGLPQPEAAIGHAAHDVTTLLAAPHVIMTRALKIDGVPTVASRWLLRVRALLDGLDASAALEPALPWLAWARSRDFAGPHRPAERPRPRPAVALRPRQLSVTAIEKWIADPYTIFAQHILDLHEMPALGEDPDVALRGQILHEALGRFARAHPSALPDDIAGTLMGFAQLAMGDALIHPRVRAFWWPRFERFAQWFAQTEPTLRVAVRQCVAEVNGAMVLKGLAGPFTLKARADRLDVTAAGVMIYDYKTGTPPTGKMVAAGTAPQMPLEAAIVMAGGFAGLSVTDVAGLAYITVKGGEPAGEIIPVKPDDLASLVARQRVGLEALIARFDDPETPYLALRRPGAAFENLYRYAVYGQLARVKEWLGEDEGEATT